MSAPKAEDVHKLPDQLQSEVSESSPARLKHVETHEKNILPTKEDLVQERQHVELVSGIENFEQFNLKKVDTDEKHVLPSKEDIIKEKAPQLAANFDHSALKHVDPQVKTINDGW